MNAPSKKPFFYLNDEFMEFDNYPSLKRHLKEAIYQSFEKEITVIRTRRGEWGEWFEKWHIVNDKPKIYKEGWM